MRKNPRFGPFRSRIRGYKYVTIGIEDALTRTLFNTSSRTFLPVISHFFTNGWLRLGILVHAEHVILADGQKDEKKRKETSTGVNAFARRKDQTAHEQTRHT